MSSPSAGPERHDPGPALRAVVAIPVCNEAERIGACLRALAEQDDASARGLGVLLFLNNCTDGTVHEVAAFQAAHRLPLRVVERTFAGANAGWARREAMEAAAEWLDACGAGDGLILTSDADSCVPRDWLARNAAGIAAGVDAVAGQIALDPAEAARLPDALHARGRLEAAYETALTELEARIDPIAHDPWPRHRTTSGASLAVRLSAYRRVGGMPPLAYGEDRAFVSALLSSDARLRHDPGLVVVTSGRLDGRAPGGAAETMRLRCEQPDAPCDPRLEPLTRALWRYGWRRRLRRLASDGRLARTRLWAPWLGIAADAARAIAALPATGAVLAAVEAASPRLAYRPLRPAALPGAIRRARLALRLLGTGARPLAPARKPAGPGPRTPHPVEQPGNA